MDDHSTGDICRVCRCEATADRQLFHPCICSGSIKWIHEDCLQQWMRYSRKEYCELCGHRFSFTPIYSPDMPRVLPLRDVAGGLLLSVGRAVKYWLHYTLVAFAWLVIVPLTAYRTYRFLFSSIVPHAGGFLMSLHSDVFSTSNIATDALRGCLVVSCTLFAFIGLIWLREQILHGGGPDWLEREDPPPVAAAAAEVVRPAPADAANRARDERRANAADAVLADDVLADAAQQQPAANEPNGNAAPPLDGLQAAAGNNAPPPAPVDPIDEPRINPAEPPPPADEAADDNDPIDVNDDGADDAAGDDAPAGEEANWNPMEWERAAEELTWERLLGLDGSMVFLEHVFWVISLNTIFILVFAYWPYAIGNGIVLACGLLRDKKQVLQYHGLITTMIGYAIVGIVFVELHAVARYMRLYRAKRILGLCYIVVKVSLLSVVEIGLLPLVCGWWLDICSLPIFDATLKDRKASFRQAPGTSLFIHWMFGMVFVYYFASFVVLLREILRPGMLWFLRNLNDPDFSPIQEMIHLPVLQHIRRLLVSAAMFGSTIMLILWLPIQILKFGWPSFLPYTLSGDSEVNELSLQLLLLQIILPGFFEQSHTRIWLKNVVDVWCDVVASLLGLRSYLLGDNSEYGEDDDAPLDENEEDQLPDNEPQGLGAAHQVLWQRDVPMGYQLYHQPIWFHLRLAALVALMAVSLCVGSLLTLTIPVWVGRHSISLWNIGGHLHYLSLGLMVLHAPAMDSGNDTLLNKTIDALNETASEAIASVGEAAAQTIATAASASAAAATTAEEVAHGRPHELYTVALGIYLCWMMMRGMAIALNLLPQGRSAVIAKLRHWLNVAVSYAMAVTIFVLMLGVIPLMFGLLLELVVVIPLRVPVEQTPIHLLWTDWALGVLYTKIACAITLMGPDCALKRALDRAYRDGIRDIDLRFIIRDLAAPVIGFFGLALAVPYVIAHSFAPLVYSDPLMRVFIARRVYPFFLAVAVLFLILLLQVRQFRKLYVAIKNDKYLVGQRLVNYDHRRRKQESQAAAAKAAANAAAAPANAD